MAVGALVTLLGLRLEQPQMTFAVAYAHPLKSEILLIRCVHFNERMCSDFAQELNAVFGAFRLDALQ